MVVAFSASRQITG